MPSIADSVVEMVQWVFPEHAGAPGQIHGGRMMQWITEAGTLAAGRVARGQVVLGATDDIDFLHPVRVGQIAILKAQVEYVGTSSLEVGVRVWAEDVKTGAREVTLNSHLVFVKMGDEVYIIPGCGSGSEGGHGTVVEPEGPDWLKERGWVDDPRAYHLDPPAIVDASVTKGRLRGLAYEHVSFASGYTPPARVVRYPSSVSR